MSERNINEINQSVESKSTLNKSPKYVAAIAWLSLMTQIQAQQILEEVKTSSWENNKSSLVIDSCERKIDTDVISIKNSDGKEIAKTLERDENPELTDYNLSDLSIVSNYDFEEKMYLHSEQTTTVNEKHPGNFSNAYDISSFYTANHVWIETQCDPEQDGNTVERWEQKIISFDNMNDRDKELYFRLLNTVFANAKIKHTGGDLPDNMSRHKLEHIVTGISSIATRQLAIPSVNTEIKQPLEKSSNTVSKYNLNIITELAYIENLLMGSTPKVIDRWDGVLYALPYMTQNFMDFLATVDTEGNQFITTEQINSILAITDQLNELSLVEAVESVDYVKVQEEYKSFFLNEKLATRFVWELESLPMDLQTMLLSNFQSASENLDPNITDRNKHKFAISLLKIYQEIEKKSGSVEQRVQSIIKGFSELSGTQFESNVTLIAKESDYTEGVSADFTPEQKIELARLKQSIQTSQNNIQTSQNNIQTSQNNIALDKQTIEKIDKLSAVFSKNNN